MLGLQENELCPFSGAGLALQQEPKLIHCQCGRSFKRSPAPAPGDADTISPHSILQACRAQQGSPNPPQRAGPTQLSPSAAARLPAASQGPGAQLQRGFTPSSSLIFISGGWGCHGDTSASPWGAALCLSRAERAGMTFPKGKQASGVSRSQGWGYSPSPPSLRVGAAASQCLQTLPCWMDF